MLQYSTTGNWTASEIHEIGLREVARIRSKMEAIKTSLGYEGPLSDFIDFIRTDERFYFTNDSAGRERYIQKTEEALTFIHGRLPDFFGVLPKADLTVKRVEAFREQDGGSAHYAAGTPDGSRPGIYYLHLSDMTAKNTTVLEADAYHEGIPGHHMETSISLELEDIPEFRKQAFFQSYSEGWALYAESLAKEMGAYDDPYSDFGRLTSEMWRAVRLVVDTGIHAKAWTEDQAVTYFLDNAAASRTEVEFEIRRYFVLPGQATSYKIGMLKIQQLRADAHERLGDAFDIRAFHDSVIGGGPLPELLLERRVNEWIDRVALD